MCQLAGCSLNNPTLNSIFLSTMLRIDCVNNGDGTGFLTVGEKEITLWKDETSADEIDNLGVIIKSMSKSPSPIIGHVRAASKGIKVTKDNAHPFMGKRFVLAHNGRLYDKDESVTYNASSTTDDTGLASDSQKFLERLEKEAKLKKSATIVELLNGAMSDFKGKFAFLIFDRATNKHYAARGSSADLHMAKISRKVEGDGKESFVPVGYLVNTKKQSLADAVMIALPIAQIVTGKEIVLEDLIELDKNSVYEFGKTSLVKIGELVEKPTYTPSTTTHSHNTTTASKLNFSPNLSIPVIAAADKIARFMMKNFLTVEDIDNLFLLALGVPMADAGLLEMEIFVQDVIPELSCAKKVRKRMDSACGNRGKVWPIVYSKIPGIEYPWTASSPEVINQTIGWLANWNKRS